MSDETNHLSSNDWETARRVLRAVLKNPALADAENEFKTLVAGVNRLGRKHARQQEMAARPLPVRREAQGQESQNKEVRRKCYICKAPFLTPHPHISCSALLAAQ